jgi:predicted component of type VI protein secretion system
MICESCGNEHDGTFASGRFCCKACSNRRKMNDETKQKISETLIDGITSGRIKSGYSTPKTLKPRTQEHTDKIVQAVKLRWDAKGRLSEEQKKARNKANVYAYRARLKNAIPEDADLKLIQMIYEMCPKGYHVDHIIALAARWIASSRQPSILTCF